MKIPRCPTPGCNNKVTLLFQEGAFCEACTYGIVLTKVEEIIKTVETRWSERVNNLEKKIKVQDRQILKTATQLYELADLMKTTMSQVVILQKQLK